MVLPVDVQPAQVGDVVRVQVAEGDGVHLERVDDALQRPERPVAEVEDDGPGVP
ncbi:hypothetical protein GCM10025864_43690 [Luteimicrobium album]|uniref:Uncharacterized protein n=1 Tax=Luteimicrobium album TaxID=1054550 RepID=A0ABQ6IA80_9MICO|nr:hypothetical protein GCM10025864_43690 [Luteimicrobium album]